MNIESILPDDVASETPQGGQFSFNLDTPTDVLEVWLLMHEGRAYDSFKVLGFSQQLNRTILCCLTQGSGKRRRICPPLFSMGL